MRAQDQVGGRIGDADLINRRKVDVKPLLSGVYGLDEAVSAFETAGDRSRSMKVQLSF